MHKVFNKASKAIKKTKKESKQYLCIPKQT